MVAVVAVDKLNKRLGKSRLHIHSWSTVAGEQDSCIQWQQGHIHTGFVGFQRSHIVGPAIGGLGNYIDFVAEDNRRFGLGNNIDV